VSIDCSCETPGQVAVLCTALGQAAPNSNNAVRHLGDGANTLVHDLFTPSSNGTASGLLGLRNARLRDGRSVAQNPTIDASVKASLSLPVCGQAGAGQPTAISGYAN